MKKTLILLCALFCAVSIAAQPPICMRDSVIYGAPIDSLLWPLPYKPTAPFYNLNDACIDLPYAQSVTVNVPNSYLNIAVTHVSIATTGAISDLPIGLTYACDPPNCVFNANTLGCIILYGTPTNANVAPDTFDLGITATVFTALGPIPITFPGQVAPGSHYYLKLKPSNCLVGSYDLGSQFTLLKNAPNPFGGQTLITAESLVEADFQFEVFDLLGQRVYTDQVRLEVGRNEFTFDAGSLANGAYFYSLSNREGKAVRRMVVAR
ncbi:MAG: T9SS type A sorting domain-containing protein [Saprospiraceae bacterium]